MEHGSFATAINCMDGRAQEPVIAFLKEHFSVDFVDMITEAGVDGLFARNIGVEILSVRTRTGVSVHKHNSKGIAVVGHHDCAGHPVSPEQHIEDIKRAVGLVKSWELGVPVIGLWLNENFRVEQIA